MTESVLIVGAGSGLSASLARLCSSKGMKVVLAARDIEKLQDLKKEIGANTIKCDATKIKSVTNLFKKTERLDFEGNDYQIPTNWIIKKKSELKFPSSQIGIGYSLEEEN